jgi:hypothetical protein
MVVDCISFNASMRRLFRMVSDEKFFVCICKNTAMGFSGFSAVC